MLGKATLFVCWLAIATSASASDVLPQLSLKQFNDRWSGTYLNAFAGAARSVGLTSFTSEEAVAATFGVGLGLDTETSGVVAGLELSGSWVDSISDWRAVFRGRLGYDLDGKSLLYFNAGLAAGDVDEGTRENVANTGVGWTVGGGVERAIDHQWSLRAEYLHIQLYSDAGNAADDIVLGSIVRKFGAPRLGPTGRDRDTTSIGHPGGPGPWE